MTTHNSQNSSFRIFYFSIFLLMTTLLGGCVTAVPFPGHAPYKARSIVPGNLVIVLPDHYSKVTHEAKVRTGFLMVDKYKIFYGQAMEEEATARFKNKFDSVEVFSDIEFAIMTDTEPRGHRFVLDEKAEEKRGGPEEYTDEQLADLKENLEFAPSFARYPEGWLIRIYDVDFRYDKGLSQYRFEVEFYNRNTDEMLFSGTLRGRGTSKGDSVDATKNRRIILDSVTNAFANAYLSLDQQIDEALGE